MEKNTPKDAGRRRIGRVVVIAVIALAAASIAWWLLVYGRDVLALLTDGRRVQEQAARLGPLAPVVWLAILVALAESARTADGMDGTVCGCAFIAMLGLMTAMTLLPAEPLELAAGYAFGFWKGALVCFAGSLVGAVAIIVLVRLVGDRALALFLSRKRLDDLERFAASPRFELILFVYFLVPGLPKDLMTYAAALARVKPLRILLITSVGRVPSIAASVLASSLAADGDWRAAGVVLAGIVVLVLAGAAVYARVRMRHRSRSQSS